MSNVYQEKPNIVEVTVTDETGTAIRYVVGKTLDEVIATVTGETVPAWVGKPKKERKARRTKAEIVAAAAEPTNTQGDKTWPA